MPNVEFLSQYNKNLAQHVAMGLQLRLRFEQEVRLLKKARAQYARRDQRIQVREEEIKKLDQEIHAIAGCRWAIGHDLLLAVMKCGESIELRQVFADIVFARIAKGISEGLKYWVEYGKANLDLEAIEAYDPEAETKYVTALHALRD
nr:hypothetical protein [Tanacetum cinerariifolium]